MISRRKMISRVVTAASIAVVGSQAAFADSPKEEVRYRLVNWKSKCIHDAELAESLVKTLTDLKCEVRKMGHDGHLDVKYRCPEWRKMTLKTHEDAHKWEAWLKHYGFETQHIH